MPRRSHLLKPRHWASAGHLNLSLLCVRKRRSPRECIRSTVTFLPTIPRASGREIGPRQIAGRRRGWPRSTTVLGKKKAGAAACERDAIGNTPQCPKSVSITPPTHANPIRSLSYRQDRHTCRRPSSPHQRPCQGFQAPSFSRGCRPRRTPDLVATELTSLLDLAPMMPRLLRRCGAAHHQGHR